MRKFDNIVKKPWGYEYLAYENENVALWCLYIAPDQSTSMHCHPDKTTGLISINGSVEVSFLNDSFKLDSLKKIMIRKGLFHSTKTISKEGAYIFEIETPVDKHNLVRLKDKYGREGTPYEDSTYEMPKKDDCLWIEDPPRGEMRTYAFDNTDTILAIYNIEDSSFFQTFKNEENVMFLRGGLVTDYGTNVAGPGDIVSIGVLRELIKVFKDIKDDTVIMIMRKND